MSSTVRSVGFIAMLQTPISEDQREELSERLYDEKSTLDITYDGTMVFSDIYRHHSISDREEDIYSLDIGTRHHNLEDFVMKLSHHQLEIVFTTIRPYNCIWYNGADCPVSLLTPQEYQTYM